MIEVDDSTKTRLARHGANKLYDVDYDERQTMTDPELVGLFDGMWSRGVESLVETGEECSAEEASRRLPDNCHRFIDATQSQRSFRYKKAEFIAQVRTGDGSSTLTQLWRVVSSDTHPKTIFLTFDSVEEREDFAELAESLGWGDEELGLRLLRDFAAVHRRG